MNIIKEIREKQNQIVSMINTIFDEIVKDVEKFKTEKNQDIFEYEISYPITNTTGFKGKKPIAVIINQQRIDAPTWKNVVKNILKNVLKDSNMRDRIFKLRDKLFGRKRKRLSSSQNEMRSPLKLDNNLYLETHYDTETLMNLLLEILNDISYDYNNIEIIIRN